MNYIEILKGELDSVLIGCVQHIAIIFDDGSILASTPEFYLYESTENNTNEVENILSLMNSYRYSNTTITINRVDYRIVSYNYHYNAYDLSYSIGGACIYKCNRCVIFASWSDSFCMDASTKNSMKGYIECERIGEHLKNYGY